MTDRNLTFDQFAELIRVELLCKLDGYSSLQKFQADFMQYECLDPEIEARKFGFRSLRNLLESGQMRPFVNIFEMTEAGKQPQTVYIGKEPPKHILEAQRKGQEQEEMGKKKRKQIYWEQENEKGKQIADCSSCAKKEAELAKMQNELEKLRKEHKLLKDGVHKFITEHAKMLGGSSHSFSARESTPHFGTRRTAPSSAAFKPISPVKGSKKGKKSSSFSPQGKGHAARDFVNLSVSKLLEGLKERNRLIPIPQCDKCHRVGHVAGDCFGYQPQVKLRDRIQFLSPVKGPERKSRQDCAHCGGHHFTRDCPRGGSCRNLPQTNSVEFVECLVTGPNPRCFCCATNSGHLSINCPYRHPDSHLFPNLCWNCASKHHRAKMCPKPPIGPIGETHVVPGIDREILRAARKCY